MSRADLLMCASRRTLEEAREMFPGTRCELVRDSLDEDFWDPFRSHRDREILGETGDEEVSPGVSGREGPQMEVAVRQRGDVHAPGGGQGGHPPVPDRLGPGRLGEDSRLFPTCRGGSLPQCLRRIPQPAA